MKHQHLSHIKKAIAPHQHESAIARSSSHPIEELQGAIGNRAVNQLLANQPIVQAKPMFGGLSRELRSSIQPKLTISESLSDSNIIQRVTSKTHPEYEFFEEEQPRSLWTDKIFKRQTSIPLRDRPWTLSSIDITLKAYHEDKAENQPYRHLTRHLERIVYLINRRLRETIFSSKERQALVILKQQVENEHQTNLTARDLQSSKELQYLGNPMNPHYMIFATKSTYEMLSRVNNEEELFKSNDDTEGPTKEQIRQGNLGDCYLLATLAAIVNHSDGPNLIKQMFRLEKPGDKDTLKNQIPEVSVRFYSQSKLAETEPSENFQESWVKVTLAPGEKGVSFNPKPSYAPWVLAYELAYAAWEGKGELNRIENGFGSDAMAAVLGPKASQIKRRARITSRKWWKKAVTFEAVHKRLNRKTDGGRSIREVVTISTKELDPAISLKSGDKLHGLHEYAVVGCDPKKKILTLYNPHGLEIKVTASELEKYFTDISYTKGGIKNESKDGEDSSITIF
ncbi:MAG: C2 family cysteine protease [Oscillatoriaceae cyanobacterium Prado104]|jgi:hypothetical protein|nr:C2 family cysteine protease [Oscillatoriaceae cyanobacterium Prado104]